MKKRARLLTGLLCMLVLMACLLTACEDKYERRDKDPADETTVTGKPADTSVTPTAEVTPEATPTSEVTPEATPTAEVTPEATSTPTPAQEKMPQLKGVDYHEAEQKLKGLKVQLQIVLQPDKEYNDYPVGTVIRTMPEAGETLTDGTVVTLYYSIGQEQVTIPMDLVGKTEPQVRELLGNKLNIHIEWVESDDVEENCVVSTDPVGGTTVAAGSTMIIYLNGRNTKVTTVPNVVGLKEMDAMAKLSVAGLNYDVSNRVYDATVPAGLVIAQDPDPAVGTVTRGTTVKLTISLGSEPVSTPTGKPIEVGNPEKTTEVKDDLEVVSMLVPEDADIETDDAGIVAIGDDYYMDLWYMNTSFDGAIFDADDLAELMKIEEYVLDNLDVDTAKLYGEIAEATVNGVHCYVGPYTEMTYEAENGTAKGCGRFVFYDCVDTCGVYMAQYMIRNTDHDSILAQYAELDEQLMNCILSVKQLESPVDDSLVNYEEEFPDGRRVEFIASRDEITGMKIIEVAGILEIYFGEATDGYIQIEHTDANSAEAFYEAVKQEFGGEQYVYTDLSDVYGRMAYSTFAVSYYIDSTGYTEEMYLAEASDGGMWLVTRFRYTENEDDGKDLLDYIIWSLKEQ